LQTAMHPERLSLDDLIAAATAAKQDRLPAGARK
jgi:hypothetical protein